MIQFKEGIKINNRYLLKKILGHGGFSVVWLADDTLVNDEVALKVYAPGIGLDDDGEKRLKEELKLVFKLHHGNLLKPTHYDVYERSPYLVLPYCECGSADKYTKPPPEGKKITEDEAWRFLHDVAAGLAYLHEQESPIIHQDIKPDNILIDKRGHYLITDFGISTKSRSTLRKSMKVAESAMAPAYTPPERFESNNTPIKASDIWSLGATVYELLEGDAPFGDYGGLVHKSGNKIPEFTGNWSRELKMIVTLCLQKETWDRPTAEQLVEWVKNRPTVEKLVEWAEEKSERLERWANGGGERPPKIPPHPRPPLPPWLKYIFMVAGAIAIVLLVVFGKDIIPKIVSSGTDTLPLTSNATYIFTKPEKLNFPSIGGTQTITVDADGSSWEVIKKADWCSTIKDGKTIEVKCERNDGKEERSDWIVVQADSKKDSTFVIQEAAPQSEIILTLSHEKLEFTDVGGTRTITVSTNSDMFEIEVANLPNWCTIRNKTNKSFDVECVRNTGQKRDVQITVKAGGIPWIIDVEQVAAPPPPIPLIDQIRAYAKTQETNDMKILSVSVISNGFEIKLQFPKFDPYLDTDAKKEEYKNKARNMTTGIRRQFNMQSSTQLKIIGYDFTGNDNSIFIRETY